MTFSTANQEEVLNNIYRGGGYSDPFVFTKPFWTKFENPKMINTNEFIIPTFQGDFAEVDYPDLDDQTSYETEGGCEYSLFEDDEIEEGYHLEVDADFVWTKEDIWELIETLLYKIGEIDEEGNLIDEDGNLVDTEEKKLFLINSPGDISEEVSAKILDTAKNALSKANIKAVPLLLQGGLSAYFEKP